VASRKQKAFDYKQNRYTEGYVPAPERMVKQVEPDIVISNPIVVNEVVNVKGIIKVQLIIPLATHVNGDLITNQTFEFAPAPGSAAYITVNGRTTFPANGAAEVSSSAFYITDSTGAIVRTQGTYAIGDRFVWQGSIAGIEILADDEIKLIYEI
jgi:hypothetical protein